MSRSDNCIQTVRLSAQHIRGLLDMLDEQEKNGSTELRRFKRLPFRTGKVILHVLDWGHGIESSFRVVARNLSVDGMAFIHGQMLPPGKPVLVQIPQAGGKHLSVLGHVAHCRHIEKMIHEVGLKFAGFGLAGRRAHRPARCARSR